MKLTVSLCRTPGAYARVMVASAWGAGSLLIIFNVLFLVKYINTYEELPKLNNRLAIATKLLADSDNAGEMPSQHELVRMRQQVQEVNQRISIKGIGTIQLLDWLENNLSDDIYVVELQHRPQDGELNMVANAPNSTAFTAFLNKLENEPWFSDAVLNKRNTSDNANSGILFELRVKLR